MGSVLESIKGAGNPAQLPQTKRQPEVVPYRFKIEDKGDGLKKPIPAKETTQS
jgi:hypothetical protein